MNHETSRALQEYEQALRTDSKRRLAQAAEALWEVAIPDMMETREEVIETMLLARTVSAQLNERGLFAFAVPFFHVLCKASMALDDDGVDADVRNYAECLIGVARDERALKVFSLQAKLPPAELDENMPLTRKLIESMGNDQQSLELLRLAIRANPRLKLDPNDSGAFNGTPQFQSESDHAHEPSNIGPVVSHAMISPLKVWTVQSLIQSGQIDEAALHLSEIAQTIPHSQNVVSELEANQVMENCGSIARTLKKHGYFEMAFPWFNTVCKFARKFAPDSVDTAWDHFLYAESMLEHADLSTETDQTGVRQRASVVCDLARDINDSSPDTNAKLAEKIQHLKNRC